MDSTYGYFKKYAVTCNFNWKIIIFFRGESYFWKNVVISLVAYKLIVRKFQLSEVYSIRLKSYNLEYNTIKVYFLRHSVVKINGRFIILSSFKNIYWIGQFFIIKIRNLKCNTHSAIQLLGQFIVKKPREIKWIKSTTFRHVINGLLIKWFFIGHLDGINSRNIKENLIIIAFLIQFRKPEDLMTSFPSWSASKM